MDMTPLTTLVALAAICVLSVCMRLFPVVLWGSVIHEFDPHFNFRVTKFIAQNGIINALNWFDDRAWYPLGRIVGTTVYPGLMLSASVIYWTLNWLGFSVDIRDVCVFFAPLFAAFACMAQFLLTKEITRCSNTALLSAALLSISPAYLSRSTAGSYDNEGIAIFLLIFTFYLWVKAVHTGAMFWAAAAAISYFGMVLSWGGYVFLINIIPLHVLALVISGNYSSRVYIAYSTFYPLATLSAMLVPFVGFNAAVKGEHAASHGMFALLQVVAFLYWIRAQLSADDFMKVLRFCVALGVGVVGFALALAFALGKFQWSGRSLTLLDPTYASKYIPIIASVGEHQPTSWSAFYMGMGPSMLFMPLGLYYCFEQLDSGSIFVIVYSTFAFYFSGIMVRLLLTLAPVACFLSAAGISTFSKRIAAMSKAPTEEEEGNDTSNQPTGSSLPSDPRSDVETQSQRARGRSEETSDFSEILYTVGGKLRLQKPACKSDPPKKSEVPRAIGVLLVAVSLFLILHVRHSVTVARKAYSSTQMVHESWNRTTGSKTVHDDFREAFMWLRQNTHEDAKILSWWDYGYQISSLANRTVIVDNNTWNNTHIATIGRVLGSSEDDALPILQSLGVDYILVMFGGKIGMPGDDLDKFPWILRIAGGVFADEVMESEFQVGGRAVVHENATIAMKSSLLYKFSMAEFSRVEAPAARGNGTVMGFDLNRKIEVDAKNITFKHFTEVFTSNEWIVRIYQVNPSSMRN